MIHHYSFIDKEVVAETDYFYRLEQSDINGSTSYSDVVYARIQDTDELNITVHPNPANASSVLTIGSTIAGTYTLDVTDPTGKICGTRILTSGKDGQLSYRIDQLFSITSTGLYTITIQKEGNKNSIKLLIFK
jgi:hypothetical protein